MYRKYYKYVNWTQPVFTSATTWGNVWADNYSSGSNQYPYQALDGKTSGGDEADFAAGDSNKTVNWYWDFDYKLKITQIKIWNRGNAENYGGATTYTIYGKNDDNSYEQIASISLAATAWVSGIETISSSKQYKGIKIYCSGDKTYVGIGEILLTASYLIESTSSDYDYYEDFYNYKVKKEPVRKYYKYNISSVGSPTLVNNIASNFSISNYLTLPITISSAPSSFESVVKFKTPSSWNTSVNTETLGFNSIDYCGLMLFMGTGKSSDWSAGKVGIHIGAGNNNWSVIDNSYILSTNTTYWIKTIWNGTTWTAYISLNGNDYTQIGTLTNNFGVLVDTWVLGNSIDSWSGNNPFNGSIDLSECYIKTNNQEIWRGVVEGAPSDYDYYNDFDVYKTYKESIRTYYKRFTYTSDSTFIVPSGITSLKIDCVGAKGYTATSGSYTGNGGNGGRVQCNLVVSAGQTYYLTVGTVPSTTSQTYNASDIRFGGNTLNDRIIVAGGGGSGVYRQDPRGATKGTADGGAGGGLVGGNGGNTGADRVGQGGTQSNGGLGAYSSYAYHPFTAGQGEFGLGGTGNPNAGGIAGAGGAGYYGGGGAGCNGIFISAGYSSIGAGGGGGSSYTNSSCTNVVHTQGYQNGTGYITIDYESTSSDYDYYIDVNTYKVLKV